MPSSSHSLLNELMIMFMGFFLMNASNVGKMLLILLNPLGAYRLNIFGRIVKQTIKSSKKSLILSWLPNMTIMM